MIREAIANYINAKALAVKGCEHDWEKLFERTMTSRINPGNEWEEFTYRCKKCCVSKIISTNPNNL